MLLSVDGIASGNWEWSVCNFGRVHTNLTTLKRTLRRHLRVGGQLPVACDISCCQPLLVGLLAKLVYSGRIDLADATVPIDVAAAKAISGYMGPGARRVKNPVGCEGLSPALPGRRALLHPWAARWTWTATQQRVTYSAVASLW